MSKNTCRNSICIAGISNVVDRSTASTKISSGTEFGNLLSVYFISVLELLAQWC